MNHLQYQLLLHQLSYLYRLNQSRHFPQLMSHLQYQLQPHQLSYLCRLNQSRRFLLEVHLRRVTLHQVSHLPHHFLGHSPHQLSYLYRLNQSRRLYQVQLKCYLRYLILLMFDLIIHLYQNYLHLQALHLKPPFHHEILSCHPLKLRLFAVHQTQVDYRLHQTSYLNRH